MDPPLLLDKPVIFILLLIVGQEAKIFPFKKDVQRRMGSGYVVIARVGKAAKI